MKEIVYYEKIKLWYVTWNSGYSHYISINGNEFASQYKLKIKIK